MEKYPTVQLVVLLFFFGLSACSFKGSRSFAPVEILYQPMIKHSQYRVQQGDTLYSIAWVYNKTIGDLAAANNLKRPYRLNKGQVLNLSPRYVRHVVNKPKVSAKKHVHGYQKYVKNKGQHCLQKPILKGRLHLADYPYHGLFITSPSGGKVRAACSGKVVYSGTGIKGYGHMILVESYDHLEVLAYAFNKRNLVYTGQKIKKGQDIAIIGRIPNKSRGVYVEARKGGVPIERHQLQLLFNDNCREKTTV